MWCCWFGSSPLDTESIYHRHDRREEREPSSHQSRGSANREWKGGETTHAVCAGRLRECGELDSSYDKAQWSCREVQSKLTHSNVTSEVVKQAIQGHQKKTHARLAYNYDVLGLCETCKKERKVNKIMHSETLLQCILQGLRRPVISLAV